MRQSWETMTSVSAGHIILTPTQPVGSGRPRRESNPGPPHQESRALPTELPPLIEEKEEEEKEEEGEEEEEEDLFVYLVSFLTSSSTTRLYRGRAPRQRLTILHAATYETELGDHDFCLSRSHYTNTDPTSRERAATARIEPRTSSPGVACSTD